MEYRFIADVHLGKLARWLRLLGFDTAYQNSFTVNDLMKIASEQDRILLSRNSSLSKKGSLSSFIIQNEEPALQLQELAVHFNLKDHLRPFSRCMVCNGRLESVPKENILHLLEKNTAAYFDEFWQCCDCRRIYWKGSHYEKMLKIIESMRS